MKLSKPILITLLIALFPAYTFFQMGMLNVLGSHWLKEHILAEHDVAYFSSAYLYADALMLIFSGILLDHCKPSKLIPLALLINVIGTFMLLVSHSVPWLILARIIGGLGHAFALVSAFRIGILLFDKNKHGAVIGTILTIAILGSFMAQAPFDKVITLWGWKTALSVDSTLGVILLLFMYLIFTREAETLNTSVTEAASFKEYFAGLFQAIKVPANYFCGLYICLLSLPLMLYGMLWGDDYLEAHYGLSSMDSSCASGMLFVGLIIGFPIVGWLSDKFANRRNALFLGAISTFLFLLLFTYARQLSFFEICTTLLLIGFCSASQAIGYAAVGELNPASSNSSAMGFSNVILMSLTASIQLALNQFFSPNSLTHSSLNLYVLGLIGLAVFVPFGIRKFSKLC